MDNNELRKEVREMRNNGHSEREIAKRLGFKSILEFRKTMGQIERDRLDYVGECDYKY